MTARQAFNRFDRTIRQMRSRAVLRRIGENVRLLDVGCGQDNFFVRTAPKLLAGSLGIDPNLRDEALDERGRRTTLDQVLDETNAQFDVVTSLAVIEHLPVDQVPAEMKSFLAALRPGGRLVLTTPSPRARPVLEFLAYRLRVISADEIRDHRHYYTHGELLRLAEDAGFKNASVKSFQLGMNTLLEATAA